METSLGGGELTLQKELEMSEEMENIVEWVILNLGCLPDEVVQRLHFNAWAEWADRQATKESLLRGQE